MSLGKTLLTHAITQVWENPSRDKHVIVRTKRLTRMGGAKGYVNLPWGNVLLPTGSGTFELHSLGALAPISVGINSNLDTWRPLSELLKENNTLIIPTIAGRLLNLNSVYLKLTNNKTLVMAVNFQSNTTTIKVDKDLRIKFYKSVNYATDVVNNLDYDGSYVHLPEFSSVLTTLLTKVTNFSDTHGSLPMVFINGWFSPGGLIEGELQFGDKVQVIYDPYLSLCQGDSIQRDSTGVFVSSLDSKEKIVFSKDTDINAYIDDCEFMISGTDPVTGFRRGGFFLRLQEQDIRMLTYVDWAIPSQQLLDRISELEEFSDISELTDVSFHICLRKVHRPHPKVLDGSRTVDLMNIPRENRLNSMVGMDAQVDIWKAANLEKSKFARWISAGTSYLNLNNLRGVFSAFGIYSVMEQPQRISTTDSWVLPYGATGKCTLIAFDEDGLLKDDITYVDTANHQLVEYDGNGTEIFLNDKSKDDELDVYIGSGLNTTVAVPEDFGLLVYYNNNGTLTKAVRNTDYFISNGVLSWDSRLTGFDKWVRHSGSYVHWTRDLTDDEVVNGFNLYPDNKLPAAYIGMGTLLIWRNGKALVEGIDFRVNELSEKCYLTSRTDEETTVNIKLIYAGLPTGDFEHVNVNERGWIKHGKISCNLNYDLYASRGNLVVVDGRVVKLGSNNTHEEFAHLTSTGTDLEQYNGKPWALIPKPKFLDSYEVEAFSSSMQDERELDSILEGYLSTVFPQSPCDDDFIIYGGDGKYDIVSPVMAKLIDEIREGRLDVKYNNLGSVSFNSFMSEFLHLVKVDPCADSTIDWEFAEAHLTMDDATVNVTEAQYNFLLQVNKELLNNRVVGFDTLTII